VVSQVGKLRGPNQKNEGEVRSRRQPKEKSRITKILIKSVATVSRVTPEDKIEIKIKNKRFYKDYGGGKGIRILSN